MSIQDSTLSIGVEVLFCGEWGLRLVQNPSESAGEDQRLGFGISGSGFRVKDS